MKKLIPIIATVFLVFVVGSMIAFLVLPSAFVEMNGNSRRIPTDFDYGSWTGSTYKNDFFGFSITVPEDWYISGKEEMKATIKEGLEELQSANLSNENEVKRVTKIGDITTANLFHVMRFSEEEAMEREESNSNIMSLVEKLPVKFDRAQYTKIVRQNLTRIIPSLVVKSETSKMFGGLEFTSLAVEFEMYGVPIYQEHLYCLKNGFAMAFTLGWLDDSDKEQLDAIMATLTWE